jgi:hypothetical protein
MKVQLKRRMGIPVCHVLADGRCPLCGKANAHTSPTGGHAFVCGEPGHGGARGMRATRHTSVLNVLYAAMLDRVDRAGLEVVREPHLQHQLGWEPREPMPPNSSPRADIAGESRLSDWRLVGDLVIIHPQVSSAASGGADCAKVAGRAARCAYEKKLEKYQRYWSFPKEEFTPLAIETGGRMDPAFREFLTRCVIRALGAEKYSELESEARAVYGDTIKYLLTSISVALARAAGLSLLHLSEACARERNKPAAQQVAAGGVAGAGGAQAGGAAPAAAGH